MGLGNVHLSGPYFAGADLAKVVGFDANFQGTAFDGWGPLVLGAAARTEAKLWHDSIARHVTNADLSKTSLEGADSANAIFEGTRAKEAIFLTLTFQMYNV